MTSATEQPAAPLDALVEDLQQLRSSAGGVSYAEIASRIARRRVDRGMSEAAARVARSTVFDAFRPGRRRVNRELIIEIVIALGGDENEVNAWRDRLASALTNAPAPHESASARASIRPAAHHRTQRALLAAILCIALVGLNHILNFSINALHVPLYLDMVGTAFAAFAFGPWAGVAVGVVTNLTGNMMHGDFSGSWFVLVQITGALIWGYGARSWFGRGAARFLLLNILVSIACSLVAVPVIVFAFDGVSTMNGAAALGAAAQQLGAGMLAALFSVNMLTSLADKLVSGYLASALVRLLGSHGFGHLFGAAHPLSYR